MVTTFEGVMEKIAVFRKEHENDGFGISPGYEFGHIAIDDYNLEDGYIHFCLNRADAWEKEALEDAGKLYVDPAQLALASQAIQKYKADLIAFLQWLLTVPEDARILWEDEEEPEWA